MHSSIKFGISLLIIVTIVIYFGSPFIKPISKSFEYKQLTLIKTLNENELGISYLNKNFFVSPDGRFLTYINPSLDIIMENLDLKTTDVFSDVLIKDAMRNSSLYNVMGRLPEFKWSADSHYLLFLAEKNIYVLDIETKKFSKILPPIPIYYPDSFKYDQISHRFVYYNHTEYTWVGDRIAYYCYDGDIPKISPKLCIVSLDGKFVTTIPIDKIPFQFSSSPSGKYIVYSKSDNESLLIDNKGRTIKIFNTPNLYRMDIDDIMWSNNEEFFIYYKQVGTKYSTSNLFLGSTINSDIEKLIYRDIDSSNGLIFTIDQTVFIQDDREVIKINSESFTSEKINLPSKDLGYTPHGGGGLVSKNGKFIAEMFGTHKVYTVNGGHSKYIRLAVKNIENDKAVELLSDTYFDDKVETYLFWFTNFDSLIIVKEVHFKKPLTNNINSTIRYFIYKINLDSLAT